MGYIRLDPPGQLLHYAAVQDMLRKLPGRTFFNVGCGAGEVDRRLCARGYTGGGIDFSEAAAALSRERLQADIEAGRFQLFHGDVMSGESPQIDTSDVAMSLMVMEHVEDDVAFLQRLQDFVKPGGHVVVAVPARSEKWSIEDDTVGHYRRYDRRRLKEAFEAAGLEPVAMWSVGVPVSNLLFGLGNLMIRRSQTEVAKKSSDMKRQTETSATREVPFKTVFPAWCRLILNDTVMQPFIWLQRLFYSSSLGLELLAAGRRVDTARAGSDTV